MRNNQQVLEVAIKKAIAGGWWFAGNNKKATIEIDTGYFGETLDVCIDYKMGDIVKEKISVNDIIYNHDFAKALWGKGNTFKHKDGGLVTIENPNYWKAKLRSMVVAKDPIKYLGEHI